MPKDGWRNWTKEWEKPYATEMHNRSIRIYVKIYELDHN